TGVVDEVGILHCTSNLRPILRLEELINHNLIKLYYSLIYPFLTALTETSRTDKHNELCVRASACSRVQFEFWLLIASVSCVFHAQTGSHVLHGEYSRINSINLSLSTILSKEQ
ncbi:Hypothetical predicted protein, partial [Paramuricea clavata]